MSAVKQRTDQLVHPLFEAFDIRSHLFPYRKYQPATFSYLTVRFLFEAVGNPKCRFSGDGFQTKHAIFLNIPYDLKSMKSLDFFFKIVKRRAFQAIVKY